MARKKPQKRHGKATDNSYAEQLLMWSRSLEQHRLSWEEWQHQQAKK